MPLYEYQAIDKRGRNLTGVMPAEDELSLDVKLKDAGLWLTDANITWPKTAANNPDAPVRRFKLRGARGRRELIDFCTLMTFQIRAGITVVKALEVACTDCKNPEFRDVLTDLQRQIESGMTFHEAMAYYPGVFSTHFLSVIKAGESTSNLPESFSDLKDYLEWVDKMLADVRQASIYPAIVVTVISGFAIFLFSVIIPKFADLLDKLHVQQPLLTRIVFGVGHFTQDTWWLWLPGFLLFIFILAFGRRISPKIGLAMDHIKLRLPILGELNLMLALSRFAHNLSILYRSGLPIVQSLTMCQEGLIGNMVVEKAVNQVTEDVKTGSTISEAMHRHEVFSALLLRMVSMGEASGNLDKGLDNVSDYYNEVIPRRIKNLFSVMEPALMLLLIFMVGSVALAIYLPIISLMGAIH
jgi:type II secretory pathway component PulF